MSNIASKAEWVQVSSGIWEYNSGRATLSFAAEVDPGFWALLNAGITGGFHDSAEEAMQAGTKYWKEQNV